MSDGDILVAVSGSGTTKNVVWTAEKAKTAGVRIIAVTTENDSPLANQASFIIQVPAAAKYRKAGETDTIQPLGSLFDQCVHILFDYKCLEFAAFKEVSHEQAFQKHSNME
ncbi:SIS domain-containing protein [Peribacillus deserti]|uniref:SIS domain-containing protein n=1 Tax=Peribacillus deserti TaxID=673318 RepID=A0A2N5M8J8_9BACI|nr:SIS domain-containing protein [Peribacillus deserti]PLT30665.1 hypothetical protein CUU66_06525 [Peribacillus deserti]